MGDDGRLIFGAATEGMCDRLASLLLAYTIGKQSRRSVFFQWAVNGRCGAAFERLFRLKVNGVGISPAALTPEGWPLCRQWASAAILPGVLAMQDAARLPKAPILRLEPRYWGHDYGALDEMIAASEEVESLMGNFMQSHWQEMMIGVHIRRTDKILPLGAPAHQAYATVMDEIISRMPEVCFLVASDEAAAVDALKTRYGKKMIVYPVRTLDRRADVGVVDAATTLFLLRKTVGVVGSYFSGYSLCAGWGRPFENIPSARSMNFTWEGNPFHFPSIYEALATQSFGKSSRPVT